MKIFWSWQNDTAPDCNRHFIKAALSEAVHALAGEFDVDDAGRPELDHDTKDAPGMAEIAMTILGKIQDCAVFVADLTPIARAANGKALPNPNVLIELGWAMHKPGWQRVIAIVNKAGGWAAEDLPFDVRHRRVLSYDLPQGADRAMRAKVKKRLVENLVAAIRTNIGQHLAEKAEAQEISGVAAREGEPSIWAGAGPTMDHHDSFSPGHTRMVLLPAGARGYIRLIPSGWRNGPPSVHDVAQLRDGLAEQPPSDGGSAGDFGATKEGYVRYWHTGKDDQGKLETRNLAMYFESTGEFWVVHGTAVQRLSSGDTILRPDPLLAGWSRTISTANAAFDFLGAHPTRRIEVGLTGLKGVRWPGQYQSVSPPARQEAFSIVRQINRWTSENQFGFLEAAYAGVRNLFGLPRATSKEFKDILSHWDPSRTLMRD